MFFSIVIPCYNEAENIPLLLNRFKAVIRSRRDIEVILVNNGSNDNTEEVIDRLLPKYPFVKCVTVEVNKGYGYGILCGLRAAKGDFLGWTHADMQTDPGDVLKAVRIIQKHEYDKTLYVKGTRKGRSVFDTFFTDGMSIFETLYLKQDLCDINAQPNMFSREFFEKWQEPPNDFSLDLYSLYLARKENNRVIRFPVIFPERIHGNSKWNTGLKSKWKFIKRTLIFSRNLKRGGIR